MYQRRAGNDDQLIPGQDSAAQVSRLVTVGGLIFIGAVMSNNGKRIVALSSVLILVGCADPRLGPNSKTGWVSELYTQEKLKTNRPACLAGLDTAQISGHQYAEITVPHLRSYRYVSALVPDSIKPELHDKVEISPPFCKDGALPQVVQILKHAKPKKPAAVATDKSAPP